MSVIFVNLKMTICSEIEHDGFLKVYRIAFEMSFPLRSVKIENKHIKKDPWITFSHDLGTRPNFFQINLNIQQNIRLVHLNCIIMFSMNWNQCWVKINTIWKKTWSIFKQAIGKQNDKTSLPLSFSINDQAVTNKLEAADGFND